MQIEWNDTSAFETIRALDWPLAGGMPPGVPLKSPVPLLSKRRS